MHWIALQLLPESAPPGLVVPASAQSADALDCVGWWALQFTPKVARVHDVLVLEVSSSERLFGGRQQMLRQITQSKSLPAQVQWAQAATSLIAIARLSAPHLSDAAPDALPLAALAAAQSHLATLARIGCTCWGQLRALPRGGVARRFDAALLDALDRAYGCKPELYPWLVLPEVFDVALELQAQVESAPALLFAARRLLGQLQVWLQARQRGVLALCLVWQMDQRRNTASQGELLLRTAEPTRDMAHLERLLGEHLARVTLAAPVLHLRLCSVQTEALGTPTASLLPDARRTGDGLHHLIERLEARLGSAQVLQMQPRADHRPERMQCWQGALDATGLIAACADKPWAGGLKQPPAGAIYPTWLLAQPLRLALRHGQPLYQGPLTLLLGPQRLEAGWWEVAGAALPDSTTGCALRDYFVACSEYAGLLWIYRARLGGQGACPPGEANWYLHGLFA